MFATSHYYDALEMDDDDLLCIVALASKEGWGKADLRSVIKTAEHLTGESSRFTVEAVEEAIAEAAGAVDKQIYCIACGRVVLSNREPCRTPGCREFE